MSEKEDKDVEVWTDEAGKKVEIKSFFSQVYIDEEMRRLSRKYDIWQCDGEMRGQTLGDAEIESFVARILALVRVTRDNQISLVGVKKVELELLAKRTGPKQSWELPGLIRGGTLRAKLIRGDLVVFPTEDLLENQGIPRRIPERREPLLRLGD